MEASSINHVSDTALWVAHFRAAESERPDALFHDPLAKLLAGDRGRRIAESMRGTARFTAWTLVVRTRIIDELIPMLLGEGVDTVLNLGTGLDTRPYRMSLPKSLRWIEVDYPHLIDHKETILAKEKPNCQLERVRLDLSDHAKRSALFADVAARSKKTLILTEGVLPYLTEEQVASLASDLRRHAPFHYWIAEYLSPDTYRHFRGRNLGKLRNSPFRFFPEEWFGFFEKQGWVPREVKYLTEESIKLHRRVPMPWWAFVLRPLLSAERAMRFRRASGYVVFVRNGSSA